MLVCFRYRREGEIDCGSLILDCRGMISPIMPEIQILILILDYAAIDTVLSKFSHPLNSILSIANVDLSIIDKTIR